MAELTTTSHAMLGLLSLRDWTTYELAQQMQRSFDYVWPRAERKLYDEPKRLVEVGYATSMKDMIGRRQRTIYSITPKGREALRHWLDNPIDPPSFEFEGMVRVLFSDQGGVDQLRRTLHRINEQAITGRVRFALLGKDFATTGGQFPDRTHVNALAIKFMIGYYENMSEWASWALAQTSSWDDSVSPSKTWADSAQKIFESAASFSRPASR
jgi:PadR family transcriptional regulator AphA